MKGTFSCLLFALAWLGGTHSTPAQTTDLGITNESNQIMLFWPATVSNVVLQSTTNLTPPNWVTVSNVVPGTASNTVTITGTLPAGFFRLLNTNPPAASVVGMTLISADEFTMGDLADTNESGDAAPTNVYVSAFYMDTNLVSFGQWQAVTNWAVTNGYGFDHAVTGKAANHPVQSVNWYDVVKWNNARSQQGGLTPVYYTDAGLTQIYTNGDTDAVYVNWAAQGYRLPTEAEWELAARGGLSGQRFPWGNTISESQANYYGYPGPGGYAYDLGPYGGYNTNFDTGALPYTSPVGSFAPNGYGLYDMAGNVREWCWDWYGTPYAGGSNPPGPTSGSYRVLRGGEWDLHAFYSRTANRGIDTPAFSNNCIGFRSVLSPGH
jgi:formylglycine-generating enzyme required for sulfatase activity